MGTESSGSDGTARGTRQAGRVTRRTALATGLAALGTWRQTLDGQQAAGPTELFTGERLSPKIEL
jgi:hypothetical protein